ncbi:MAG: thiamine pyrophosphate-dependent enzyme [Anaerolineae bacterium]|jgi:indolepyruvate ferredoxin oxidoreductase alpha subunit
MTSKKITGSQALAYGALEAGVDYVTGYPGSPATGVVDALLNLADDQVRVEWAVNEKSAFDTAFGASIAGFRALLCLKSVGLNVALDSLMVGNLAPGPGGFVILVGDDPGGWGSQNEEDARPLVAAAEIPLLEPTTPKDAQAVMREAFHLSERFRVPVAVRITRALVLERGAYNPPPLPERSPRQGKFERQGDRFNVLPVHVVEFHRTLHEAVDGAQAAFEDWPLNRREGKGVHGVIASGFSYHKVQQVLAQSGHPPLSILGVGTLHPLPERFIADTLDSLDAALVLEETAPYMEIQVQALAQRAGIGLPVYGRLSGHIPREGELFEQQIVAGLAALLPEWPWPSYGPGGRAMPSRQPLCEDCPYVPAFEALLAMMEQHGGRDAFVVAGETGCMVRAQLPPYELLDVKYGMGSSIGLAAGLARTGIPQKVVALSGDSALLHSGLAELIDAAQAGIDLLVVVLANETTALSGGQPHPGTDHDARGHARQPTDLAGLVQAAGADTVQVVDPEERGATEAAYEAALSAGGLAVVIARRACPKWAPVREV